jgi:hypothetical protein
LHRVASVAHNLQQGAMIALAAKMSLLIDHYLGRSSKSATSKKPSKPWGAGGLRAAVRSYG